VLGERNDWKEGKGRKKNLREEGESKLKRPKGSNFKQTGGMVTHCGFWGEKIEGRNWAREGRSGEKTLQPKREKNR